MLLQASACNAPRQKHAAYMYAANKRFCVLPDLPNHRVVFHERFVMFVANALHTLQGALQQDCLWQPLLLSLLLLKNKQKQKLKHRVRKAKCKNR